MNGPRFYLPPPKRASPLWSLASLVGHAIVTVVLVSVAGRVYQPEEPVVINLLPPGALGPRELVMPEYGGVPQGEPAGGEGGGLIAVLPTARIDTGLPSPRPAVILSDVRDLLGKPSMDTSLAPGPPGHRLIGPEYAGGRVWVRTAEAELGVVGPSKDIATHVARVNRAMRERIKAYIDTMPRDSFGLPPPPVWTTDVAGTTWGIDGKWIYLGDIKIPTALLALLPLPQGNYEQAQEAATLQQMREEILDAARRAETAADFRKYVDELRKRRDAERAARRARRDTVIP